MWVITGNNSTAVAMTVRPSRFSCRDRRPPPHKC
jgi:hypothetical protein